MVKDMIEQDVYNLSTGDVVDRIALLDSVFGIKPSVFAIKSVVDWQLSKARSGTRKTKTISEVSGTGKKPYAQKGSGRARFGSLRAVQMRGGSTVHGPVNRSHATDLPKKVRKLGLRSSLSEKLKNKCLFFVSNLDMESISTKQCSLILKKFGFRSALFSYCPLDQSQENFFLSLRNIPHCKLIPQIGLTVYDILKHDTLVLSVQAAKALEKRLAI